MNQIPVLFDLSVEESQEVSDYSDYYQILIDVLTDNRDFYSLTSEELVQMNTLALSGENKGTNVAKGFLEIYYGYIFENSALNAATATTQEAMREEKEKADKKLKPFKNGNIQIYPNPAIDEIVITLPEASPEPGNIEVRHISGKLVIREQTSPNQKIILLDISHLKNGIYILNLINGNETQGNQKLVISH